MNIQQAERTIKELLSDFTTGKLGSANKPKIEISRVGGNKDSLSGTLKVSMEAYLDVQEFLSRTTVSSPMVTNR